MWPAWVLRLRRQGLSLARAPGLGRSAGPLTGHSGGDGRCRLDLLAHCGPRLVPLALPLASQPIGGQVCVCGGASGYSDCHRFCSRCLRSAVRTARLQLYRTPPARHLRTTAPTGFALHWHSVPTTRSCPPSSGPSSHPPSSRPSRSRPRACPRPRSAQSAPPPPRRPALRP